MQILQIYRLHGFFLFRHILISALIRHYSSLLASEKLQHKARSNLAGCQRSHGFDLHRTKPKITAWNSKRGCTGISSWKSTIPGVINWRIAKEILWITRGLCGLLWLSMSFSKAPCLLKSKTHENRWQRVKHVARTRTVNLFVAIPLVTTLTSFL